MPETNNKVVRRPNDGYLGYALTQAAHCWKTGLAGVLSQLGITPPQFFAIAALYRVMINKGEQPSQRQLAERIAMDINTASQVIRALETRGIIMRHPHPSDSRSVVLALSAEGTALAKASTKRARDFNEAFFAQSSQALLHRELTDLIQIHS